MADREDFATAVGALIKGATDRLAALEYWSGVRDVSSLLSNGWAGTISLFRNGNRCSLYFESLSSAAATSSIAITLPPGFRPVDRPGARVARAMLTAGGNPATIYAADLDKWGNLRIFTDLGLVQAFSGSFEFITSEPIPTTLPGDAA